MQLDSRKFEKRCDAMGRSSLSNTLIEVVIDAAIPHVFKLEFNLIPISDVMKNVIWCQKIEIQWQKPWDMMSRQMQCDAQILFIITHLQMLMDAAMPFQYGMRWWTRSDYQSLEMRCWQNRSNAMYSDCRIFFLSALFLMIPGKCKCADAKRYIYFFWHEDVWRMRSSNDNVAIQWDLLSSTQCKKISNDVMTPMLWWCADGDGWFSCFYLENCLCWVSEWKIQRIINEKASD